MQENRDLETLHRRIAEALEGMPAEEISKLISEIEEHLAPTSES